ncbi:hypothetical protein CN575_21055 [Bacillus wiedmannii]|uniref:Group-specific protein n=1 Tax=Bacillus cereus HuA2-1 TaxID=1053201 RepID=J9BAN7_BACCE|nr:MULTISPECIES: hypothetical protein [Bacillus]AZJ24014.1 hypothetical protein CT694_31310 [Bacillus wiedmannii bv. thuringiensis]EJV76026.1 hypothetical protein IG3_05335 [Bacillus cereus HuA2-1]PEP31829.1 hypothetical protein CN575_21055 [Bacillus wiedmannii]PFZ06508.1 hypothetical protein COL75_03400 [Bacillus wiedmannii]QWH69588.1 hypothetical protein EXW41_28100 [Bacillus wiedmannii]
MEFIKYAVIIIIVLSCLSELYMFKFQKSQEARDERGLDIQYKTTNFLYNTLYLGIVILFLLNMLQYITAEQFVNILLYFFISLGIIKVAYSYWRRSY